MLGERALRVRLGAARWAIGRDAVVRVDGEFPPNAWVALFPRGAPDVAFGSRWYRARREMPWAAAYGPVEAGPHELRLYAATGWRRQGPLAVSEAFEAVTDGGPLAAAAAAPGPNLQLAAAAAAAQGDELCVATLNCWEAGARVADGLALTARLLRALNADVVCLQEINAAGAELLARISGYACVAADGNAVLSRVGITAPLRCHARHSGSHTRAIGARICVGGRFVSVFSTHLTAYPYGPYELRDGATVRRVADPLQSPQCRDIRAVLQCPDVRDAVIHGDALLLCGDHNEPSHLDHASREVTSHPHYVRARYEAAPRDPHPPV
jgi:endonuclease/exonuclease/phosphatase family metal-dependent hydrolase